MVELLGSDTSLVVVGRLCANPTATGGTFPHGGTDLGKALVCEWMPEELLADVTAEEYGGEPVEYIRAHERGVLAVVFAGAPNEVVTRLFAHSSTGASGAKVGGYGKSGDDSRLGSAGELAIMFSPRSADHPKILIRRAVPSWQDAAILRLFIGTEYGLPVAWRGIRHDTSGMYDWFKASDVSI